LGNGDVGNVVGNREIHDFRGDPAHGNVKMEDGLIVSCNAYFAQLGTYAVGAEFLFDTASQFGIEVASPNTPERLRRFLPDAAYGQGEVVASPLMMARVAATIANDGVLAPYQLVLNDHTEQKKESQTILERRDLLDKLKTYMRQVVADAKGTAKSLKDTSIAGKTGTAEVGGDQETHAWFVGFAPYNERKRIAFAVLLVNGGVGGRDATPAAREIVDAARSLNLIR
jgi:cell division protein FtsI/penicillin-binding protein 2